MESAFKKTVDRTVSKNFSRFIALIAIIFIGICFVAGIGGITPKVLNSFDDYYKENNVTDLIIKSKSDTGFTSEQMDLIESYEGVEEYRSLTSIDTTLDSLDVRYYVDDLSSSFNKLTIEEGRLPKANDEVCVNVDTSTIYKTSLNEKFTIYGTDYTVVGTIRNPLIYSMDSDYSITNEDNFLRRVFYFDSEYFNLPLPKTDIYLIFDSSVKTKDGYFYDDYLSEVKAEVKKIKTEEGFTEDDVAYLPLDKNKSYAMLTNVTDKIFIITLIFPAFFIGVVCLVVLTTMSRLVDEERSAIGCYKSLGYSNKRIAFKYLSFSFSSSIIGICLGLAAGTLFVPGIIYPAFGSMFYMPIQTYKVDGTMGLISALFMFVAVMLVTYYVCYKNINESAASLMLPKSPKPGKVILLEKIGFIWKHLKFKTKSSARNIFRYKGRLLMVVISVMGSTALVMAGLGLYDSAGTGFEIDGNVINIESTLKPISLMIVGFALALSVLVLYNLTNMNIGERKREIATLKVLGYTNLETANYIYREILVMATFGIGLGIPLGLGLIYFIFTYLKFGSITNIKWYSYVGTIVLSYIFVVIVDLSLFNKINDIDMNDSLKSME